MTPAAGEKNWQQNTQWWYCLQVKTGNSTHNGGTALRASGRDDQKALVQLLNPRTQHELRSHKENWYRMKMKIPHSP
jgi:hypothetical protein